MIIIDASMPIVSGISMIREINQLYQIKQFAH